MPEMTLKQGLAEDKNGLIAFLKSQMEARPLAVWGYGQAGKKIVDGLVKHGLRPALILEQSAALQETTDEHNIPITGPTVVLAQKTHYIIGASTNHALDMEQQLLEKGYQEPGDCFLFRNRLYLCLSAEETAANTGHCPFCEKDTVFVEKGSWLRDDYLCIHCGTVPRQRGLIRALHRFVPNWKQKQIHESSPSRYFVPWFQQRCPGYTYSHFFEDTAPAGFGEELQCENLENLSFPDESVDVFITQDVFEHLLHPQKAFEEIQRVLKVGGSHIFTVPVDEKIQTRVRAREENGQIEHLLPPQYHGNPIDEGGSLVTHDYGLDIVDMVGSQMLTTVVIERDRGLGLDGEYLHVFACKKTGLSSN